MEYHKQLLNFMAFKFLKALSIFFFLLFFQSAFADDDSRNTAPPNTGGETGPMSPSQPDFPPFKPTVTVISAVLIAMFSITFLFLLYVKHCKNGASSDTGGGGGGYYNYGGPNSARKNSGIDRSVIETLPLFRFSSLRGEKNGLECAVCLNRFEPMEVLRLLPKCKHAFHVECVDTWLDAHSTCPLCRYRVDPEDVLLIDKSKILIDDHEKPTPPPQNDVVLEVEAEMTSSPAITTKRVFGRHSSAGERRTSFFGSSFRRSFGNLKRKRHSSDREIVAVGCVDHRLRKDGLLLTTAESISNNSSNNVIGSTTSSQTGPSSSVVEMCDTSTKSSSDRRLEHRIIVSGGGVHLQRWSDVRPSDLLYLQSEKIISHNNRRFSSNQKRQHEGGGINVINERSVSEITGLNRFSSKNNINSRNCSSSRDERQAGILSRWTAWINPGVQSERTTGGGSSVQGQKNKFILN